MRASSGHVYLLEFSLFGHCFVDNCAGLMLSWLPMFGGNGMVAPIVDLVQESVAKGSHP